MPKPHTFPTLYDEALKLNISKLKAWDYLEPEQIKSGTLNWSRNGNPTGSISIQVNTQSEKPYIELDYKYRDEPRKYKVYLVAINSNLNKGKVWYFLCPHTQKRCRILYSIGGYFYHREAFRGCMYDCQILSKNDRDKLKLMKPYFCLDELYEELYKKNFKKTYAGKPTKKYIRLMNQIQKAESVSLEDINWAMIK